MVDMQLSQTFYNSGRFDIAIVADSLRDMINDGLEVFKSQEAAGLTKEEVADSLLIGQQLKEAKKAEEYRAAMLRRRQNQEAQGRDADEYLDAAENFETKGRFEVEERYPDPFGIPVSPADPEPAESLVKENDQRRERGGAVLIPGRQGLSGVRDASSTTGIDSLVADGAIRREWRERPGLAPGAVDPSRPANRQQFFTDPKYVGGRFNDDVAKDDGRDKARTAPAGIGMGGPNGLATQLADMVVRGEISENDLLPGSTTKTVGSLMREMAMAADPGLALEADKNIAKQAAERENARYSPAVRAINDQKAERRAVENIANIDNGLSSIQDIQSLGIASKKFNRGSNMSVFNVVPNADGDITDRDGGIDQMAQYLAEVGEDLPEGVAPQTPGTDTGVRTTVGAQNLADVTRMIGPGGETIGYVDSNDKFNGDVDVSGSNQRPTKTQAWLEANLPDMGRPGGTSFGYPQVNVGDTLSLLTQRLGPNAPEGGIRSLEDLENTFVRMIDSRLDKGGVLTNFDPEQGKAVRIADPGIDEVLYALNYTRNEKAQLANALMQQEAARVSPVNQGFKYLYDQGLYDPRGQFVANNFDNSVSIGRMAGEKVGRGDKKGDRVAIRGELAKLDGSTEVFKDRDPSTIFGTTPDGAQVLLPEAAQDLIDAKEGLEDAKKPFQGAAGGSKPPKQAFIRGDARGMTTRALAARMGTERAALAQGVEQRYLDDERRRNTPEPISTGRQEIQDKDAKIGAEGARRKAEDLEKKARGVKPFRGTPESFDADSIKEAGRTDGPTQEQKVQKFILDQVQRRQSIPSAGVARPSVATSIVTSPSPDPRPLAARGGWLGDATSFRSPNFNDPAAAETPLASRERVRRRGATPPPSAPSPTPTPTPKQEKSQADNIISRESTSRAEKRSPFNRRNIGIGAAGLGVAGLIGGGAYALGNRDAETRRPQEAQY